MKVGKMKQLIHFGIALLMTLAGSAVARAQARPLPSGDVQKIYDLLLKQIDQVPIYDNHSHATFPDDSDTPLQGRSSATPMTISSPNTRSGSSTRRRPRKRQAARRTGTASSTR